MLKPTEAPAWCTGGSGRGGRHCQVVEGDFEIWDFGIWRVEGFISAGWEEVDACLGMFPVGKILGKVEQGA